MNHKWLVSRREWLKRVGRRGRVPPRILLPLVSPTGDRLPALAQAPGGPVAAAPETLTAAEAETLGAIAARLIPTDGNGPGATEARAAQYIDRALGGALASFRETYRAGLAALDRYAQSTKGSPFARLSAADQDAVLRRCRAQCRHRVLASPPRSSTWFSPTPSRARSAIRTTGATRTSSDGISIGYPGVRLAVTSDEQKLNARPSPTHMSAYDYRMFSGQTPRACSARS